MKCGCVPFYAIRNSSVPICEYRRHRYCGEQFHGLTDLRDYDYLYDTNGLCNCLPQCNYVSYSYEVFTKAFLRYV